MRNIVIVYAVCPLFPKMRLYTNINILTFYNINHCPQTAKNRHLFFIKLSIYEWKVLSNKF
jgi:hypothetical protein